ncbi:MAG: SPFH domain-containing protein [Myxococcota bacterium]|nr:SPFH domain-containing protein [Myxococcota bacterium]
MEELLSALVVGGFFLGFSSLAVYITIKKLLYIAGPNEVLVFSGTPWIAGDPNNQGYTLLKGGRRIKKPIIESVSRMDLTNMTVDVAVTNAYSKGGIPLIVQGVANLKVAGHEPILGNALQRFLDRPREEIIRVAKDTLEGNLRGVLSQLTPEEVNEDKIAFAEKLLEEAEEDLASLGLVLDTLKVQNVSDEVGYLDSIGRKTSAELLRSAKIAEADAKAEAMIKDAEARERARVTEAEAEVEIARAETARMIRDAQTRKAALVAKEVGEVEALVARATSELKVQEARVEQVRRRLEADVVAPAHADMEAKRADAKARAAKVIEDGKATAMVLEEMITTWKQGGDSARDIFLMQKLEKVMGSLVGTIQEVHVDRMTVLPKGKADTTATKAVTLSEEIKAAVGVDVPKLLNKLTE